MECSVGEIGEFADLPPLYPLVNDKKDTKACKGLTITATGAFVKGTISSVFFPISWWALTMADMHIPEKNNCTSIRPSLLLNCG